MGCVSSADAEYTADEAGIVPNLFTVAAAHETVTDPDPEGDTPSADARVLDARPQSPGRLAVEPDVQQQQERATSIRDYVRTRTTMTADPDQFEDVIAAELERLARRSARNREKIFQWCDTVDVPFVADPGLYTETTVSSFDDSFSVPR